MKNILTNKYVTISALALSAIFLFGWVLPEIPYTRRLTKEQADKLKEEFKTLYLKNWMHIEDDSLPALSKTESERWSFIKNKLQLAGYILKVNVNTNSGDMDTSMSIPDYAG